METSCYLLEIKEFFNSVFFSAIAGSMAGAFAGAYGAVLFAERGKRKDQLIMEVRNTNKAINISIGVFNSLLQMKKQHIKSLKENFENQKAKCLDHKKKIDLLQINIEEKIDILFDLQNLSLPHLPVDILQKQVFEKLSLVGRPLSLTTTLIQTIDTLSITFEKRNQLIESYKANKNLTVALYFGLPTPGQVNEEYPSTINNISILTDDGIFFSQLLCKDLIEHGNETAERFKKLYKKEAPIVSKFDMEDINLSLIPEDDKYPDWFTKFVKSPSSKE